jgi:VWFA-related protein
MVLLDAVNTRYPDQILAWGAVKKVVDRLPPEERVALYVFGAGFGIRTVHDVPPAEGSLVTKPPDPGGAGSGRAPGNFNFAEIAHPIPPVQALLDSAPILNTMRALETIAGHLKGVPGRKNLLWVSAAFPLAIGNQSSPYFAQFGPEWKRTTAALNDANVSVYPIDARGVTTISAGIANIGTMRDIADATGGKAFYNRNDIATGVRAALDESREVYVLTYAPQPLVADGAYHRVRVASSRPGVRLRYRRGYDAPGKDETGSAGTEGRLTDVVSSPLDASGAGIQASVEPAADGIALVIHIDPADLNLVPHAARWAGALRLVAMQLGASGEPLGGVSQAAELNLTQTTYRQALQQGLPFEMKFQREPAAVAVRIAVVDEHGARAGSLSVSLPPR